MELQKAETTIQTYSNKYPFQLKDDRNIKNALSVACGQIARIAGKELPPEDVRYIINDLFEVWTHNPVTDLIEAFKRLARSKAYGKITLGDLHEIMATIETEKGNNRTAEHKERLTESKHLKPIQDIASEYEKQKVKR